MAIKAYKGFNKDMTCRGFQYEEGKTYEMEGDIKACESGFHACEYPLDCLNYYAPAESVYHEVEQDGVISKDSDDTKVASSKIKIGARLDIPNLVSASIEYVKERATKKSKGSCLRSDNSVASNSGDNSVASNSGYNSVASNSGDNSVASNSGYNSVASNSGYNSVASNSGYKSVASNSGYNSVASNSGYKSVAVAWGRVSKAKASLGSYLVLSEYGEWNGKEYPLLCAKMEKVDGEKIKADTYYMLKNGEFVEVK
jgi:hypothetical protein